MSNLSVICVLKTGGDYDARYVKALKKSVSERLQSVTHDFICMSDVFIDDVKTIPLQNNWKGWWSKIEMFQIEGPCIFFDLDTVIVGDLTQFCDVVLNTQEKKIWMLRPFGRHEIMASGIMAWTGDWYELYESFNYQKDSKRFRGDQDFLASILKDAKNQCFIQDSVGGIYSYKYHCKENLPSDSRIICFHGKPRPHQVSDEWVDKNWRT